MFWHKVEIVMYLKSYHGFLRKNSCWPTSTPRGRTIAGGKNSMADKTQIKTKSKETKQKYKKKPLLEEGKNQYEVVPPKKDSLKYHPPQGDYNYA